MLMSPRSAIDAVVPPVVGSRQTEMNGSFSCFNELIAAIILGICINEKLDSCIRIPPLVEKKRRQVY